MKDIFYKRDIIKLCEIFEINGKEIWDNMKDGGHNLIIGEGFFFQKTTKSKELATIGLDAFYTCPVGIIDIKDGKDNEVSYFFFTFGKGSITQELYQGINNAKLMYKFETGKIPDMAKAFTNI